MDLEGQQSAGAVGAPGRAQGTLLFASLRWPRRGGACVGLPEEREGRRVVVVMVGGLPVH